MDSLNRSVNLTTELVERLMKDETDEIFEFMNSKSEKFEGVYDCIMYSLVKVYVAVFSLNSEDIADANSMVKECLDFCSTKRKTRTIVSTVADVLKIKPSYKHFTEEEVHAELAYGLLIGMRGLLDFLKSGILNLITGSYRLKLAFESIELCRKLIKHHSFASEKLADTFTQGSKFGIGLVNLCLSHIPKRLLRILQLIGYHGETETGIKALTEGCTDIQSVHFGAVMCFLAINIFTLSIKQILGNGCTEEDIAVLQPIIIDYDRKYSHSVFLHFVKGRIAYLKGQTEQACGYLQDGLAIETKRLTIKVILILERISYHVIQNECRKASKLVKKIRLETNLSPCSSAYCEAAMLLSCQDITDEERQYVTQLLEMAPDCLVEYCGKHIPIEKFLSKKARQYFAQDKFLMLPQYEILYYVNCFTLLARQPDNLRRVINEIDQQLAKLESRKEWQFYPDNYCLAMLLKGVCLKDLGQYTEAGQCFQDVINRENEIFTDIQLAMCAHLEKGILDTSQGNLEEALVHFKLAKKRRLFWIEFRIHQAKEHTYKLLNQRRNTENFE
ncbi:Tetratricopeptide repeat protein 39B [Chamberlinius hualienensis]